MKTYKIDTGNSNTGTCGFVAYVEAKSPEQALRILREDVGREGYKVLRSDAVELLVYLNPDNVKIEEVEEEE